MGTKGYTKHALYRAKQRYSETLEQAPDITEIRSKGYTKKHVGNTHNSLYKYFRKHERDNAQAYIYKRRLYIISVDTQKIITTYDIPKKYLQAYCL